MRLQALPESMKRRSNRVRPLGDGITPFDVMPLRETARVAEVLKPWLRDAGMAAG